MKQLSVLIKPSSSLCNMRCKYCFYHDISDDRAVRSYGFMSEKTAKNLIDAAFDTPANSIHFAFQGGEPTLAGLDFYKNFVSLVKLKDPNRLVSFSIQTNGLMIDEPFAAFLAEHHFLAGLSIDGTKDIHDFLRPDAAGNGTYAKTVKTAKLFEKTGVEYNILVVLSATVARHIEKVYSALKREGFRYLQFIPCLDGLDNPPFENGYSLKPALYARCMRQLFQLYFEDYIKGQFVSIRYFDNLVSLAADHLPEMCGMLGYCTGQFVIEGDGTVFPCDFYCTDAWKMGNINTASFSALYEGETMRRFIESSKADDKKCVECPVFTLCRGGCRRNRDLSSNGRAGENIYCGAIREFLEFAAPYLRKMASGR